MPPYPTMIDPDEALRLVLEAAGPPEAAEIPLDAACGHCLAEEVRADRDYPSFPRAMMDGYAVRTADAGATVDVIGEVAAGQEPGIPVTEGRCLEIMTGAACPPGTEAVVEKEAVRRDGTRVRLPPSIRTGAHIAAIGSECPAGDVVLSPGQPIAPLAVAVLASFGHGTVRVFRRPSMAIVTTGAELALPGRDPQPAQIRNSNGPMLAAMAGRIGIDRPTCLHAQDQVEAIADAIRHAGPREMIVISGGVSAGAYDLVPQAVEAVGAEIVFHKVAQKPGKPFLFARRARQLLFGLPGNPLACHLGFHRYVAAAVRQREGKPVVRQSFRGRLVVAARPLEGRTFFLLAHARAIGSSDPGWEVHPLHSVSSADVFTPCTANCYLRIPPSGSTIPAGRIVCFEWID
jgi:molybdopterin molybdotransferase